MKHGFFKVAAATPYVSVADCESNLSRILELVKQAEDEGARLIAFPELALTGSTCGDLFFSDTLLTSAKSALCSLLLQTKNSDTIIIIGFPLIVNDKLYNCSAFCQKGQILGIIPKSVLSNSRSSDDARYFCSYTGDTVDIKIGEYSTLFGVRQIFECENMPSLKIGIEIGSEAYAPVPPSALAAAAGATVIVRPFSEHETVGAEEYRTLTAKALSSRQRCGYVLVGSGDGESTTDGVFGGCRAMIENGKIIAESRAFEASCNGLTVCELDIELISQERRRAGSLSSLPADSFTSSTFTLDMRETDLTRKISPFPFIPENDGERTQRCDKILTIQAKGLATRIERAYAKTCVIGISGGLDSCLAILVAAKAMDILGRPRDGIIGVTMPCFGTTKRTRSNAQILCAELGTQLRCVNIGESVKQHFADIGHDENDHSVVYENAQARERTQVIMDIANMENGLVVGTGDLSELALGWATYNGDHMSMYGVNGGVPKTLIRYIVTHCADDAETKGHGGLAAVLRDILDTPVSPELLPADENGNIAQRTEDLVGPYEIHDFYIFHTLRYGFSPDKLYRMAKVAFAGRYDDETLLKWLKSFARRFFAQQFKRSCLPDGPKVGTVGVSPRGDLRMPSDASAAQWLKIIEKL